MRLRSAEIADCAAIATTWHDGWRDGHIGHVPDELVPERTPESFLSRTSTRIAEPGDATTIVAEIEIDGEPAVAGFIMIVDDELEQIYVGADHRGSGLADVLLAEAERSIGAAGFETAWLAVVAGNARARAFYEKRGWADDGDLAYMAATADGEFLVPSRRYVKPLG